MKTDGTTNQDIQSVSQDLVTSGSGSRNLFPNVGCMTGLDLAQIHLRKLYHSWDDLAYLKNQSCYQPKKFLYSFEETIPQIPEFWTQFLKCTFNVLDQAKSIQDKTVLFKDMICNDQIILPTNNQVSIANL